ncbi:TPA: hypothetical protein RU399_004124 [Klebsiella pneumoniae]|nr:hypothetical protein [Klebsiella pneumoniae]HBQ2295948.1 hypothetical protein [Klebsiella pneumoniae]HDZ9776430.1 hypothetical protein [Klebsiella pneumoniae]
MTFRITANVFPAVSGLPTLGQSFSDLLVDGSLSLLDKGSFPAVLGLIPGANLGNLATEYASKQTSNPVNAYLKNISPDNFPTATTDFTQYFKASLTARGGLHILPTIGLNSSKAIGLAIRTLPDAATTAILSTTKNIYIDIWARITRLPVVNSGGPATWKKINIHAFAIDGDTSTSRANLASMQFDLTDPALPAAQVPAGAEQLLSAEYLHSGLRLNDARMLASAASCNPSDATQYRPTIPFSILEGNYNGYGIIIYGSYMEDLTTSGRTADQVAAIRKKDFDAAFAMGGRFYNDSWTV